ncbi:hypothetical protein BDW66DRAFT_146995 [Aspergillus desertorum]
MSKSNTDDSPGTEQSDDLTLQACPQNFPLHPFAQLARVLEHPASLAVELPIDGRHAGPANASLRSRHHGELAVSDEEGLITTPGKHRMTAAHAVHVGMAFPAKEYGSFTSIRNYNTVRYAA